MKRALLVVDVLPDFMPGGPLPAKGGDEIVEPINRRMRSSEYTVIVAVKEGHPLDHFSFKAYGVHGVAGTPGAELHPDLDRKLMAAIFQKGMDKELECMSAFATEPDAKGIRYGTGLESYLRALGVTDVDVAGLVFELCVKKTALDSANCGFVTRVLMDCTCALDGGNVAGVINELAVAGVKIVGE